MILISVLIDTSFLVAYYDVRDKNHSRAVELLKELETKKFGSLYLSDYIFDETITIIKKYKGKEIAKEKGTAIVNSLQMLNVDINVFKIAWELCKKIDALSFTDCTSLIVMKHYAIEYMATFDSDFNGLTTVLK